MKSITLLTVFLVLQVTCFRIEETQMNSHIQLYSSAQTCNRTNFDFMGKEYLSKNTYLSRGFDVFIENYLPYLESINWQPNQNITYRISGQFSFKLNDQNQYVTFGENETISVQGANTELTVEFRWSSYREGDEYGRGGDGIIKAISSELPFSFKIDRPSNSSQQPGFKLSSPAPNFTFYNFTIQQIDCSQMDKPCNITDQDFSALKFMMFQAPLQTLKNFKYQIQQRLNLNFENALSFVICCWYSPTYPTNTYYWRGQIQPQQLFTMNINRTNLDIRIQTTGPNPGIYSRSLLQISPNDKCGPQLPENPYNKSTYGEGQEWISFTFLENFLRQGILAKQLNTILNDQFWTVKTFKYTVEDLSTMMSNLTNTFSPYSSVRGGCQMDPENFQIKKSKSGKNIEVRTISKCYLVVGSKKVIEFTINFISSVSIKFSKFSLDFWTESNQIVRLTFNDSFGFRLSNELRAHYVVKESLDRLYENKLFGSRWNRFLAQKVPMYFVDDYGILIYQGKSKQ